MSDLEKLKAWRAATQEARYGGVRTVESDGRKVEYRSDAEMVRALADLDREINRLSGQGTVSAVRVFGSKGL